MIDIGTRSDSSLLCAGIDVGTNSVKIIIAEIGKGIARSVFEQSMTTRLGEGMQAQAQRMREASMRRTLDAIEELVEQARIRDVERIAAVGTAALRDAVNRDEFLRRVKERCGLSLEVITGEEEARLSFLAVRLDPIWNDCSSLLVIDIGGGSTELIQGDQESSRIKNRVSVNLGAVRLTERYLKSDPPTISQLSDANEAVAASFSQSLLAPSGAARVVGVGGTVTNLAAMDRGDRSDPETIHGYILPVDHLEDLIGRLSSSSVSERQKIPGLDPRRADIILGGAILLSQALDYIRTGFVEVSVRGLRWGLLYDRFCK